MFKDALSDGSASVWAEVELAFWSNGGNEKGTANVRMDEIAKQVVRNQYPLLFLRPFLDAGKDIDLRRDDRLVRRWVVCSHVSLFFR